MSETGTNGTALATVENKQLNARIGAHGVMLTSFDELARFSQMVARSGFAPKGMEKPEAVGVAIQLGLEIGISPMQALQSIAVINGRPSIYGDAAKALVEASGLLEDYEQWYECDGKRLQTEGGIDRGPTVAELKNETLTCFVLSKRRGRKAVVTPFSVADAKNAALWGKSGPWSQYPARMLLFRARGFNLRDNFGDVLKGLRTTEEMYDTPIDVTPTTNAEPTAPPIALADRLKQRAAILDEAKQAPTPENQDVDPLPTITAAQRGEIEDMLDQRNVATRTYRAELKQAYGVESLDLLTEEQASAEIQRLFAMVGASN